MNIIFYDVKNKMKKCPECKSYNLKYDSDHEEVYCGKCGLVLKNNDSISYSYYIKIWRSKYDKQTEKQHRYKKMEHNSNR